MLLSETTLDLIETRASKGVPKDFVSYFTTSNGTDKEVNKLFLDMVRNDPIISSAMDITIETATHNGYNFFPKPTKEDEKYEKQAQEAKLYFDDVLDYDIVQDNIFANLFLYQDCPVELRANNQRKINELHVLEMTELDVEYGEHGEIVRYKQNTNTSNAEWSADEVMFIQSRQIGSKVKSYNPLESVSLNYATLLYANSHLLSILKNMPPKLLFILKNADKQTRSMFIQNLRLARVNPAIDLVANGEAEAKTIEFTYNGLFEVLKYVRGQVLMITRVPPVWVGIIEADGANRGNSEAQISAFMARIMKMQQRVASHINKDLLPRLGYKNVWFKYNPPSLKIEKEIIENAERLSNLGSNPEVISRYLSERGIRVGKGQIEKVDAKKDKDLMDSRKRKDGATEGVTSNLDRDGVSEAGAKKLETRSFREYPYTY